MVTVGKREGEIVGMVMQEHGGLKAADNVLFCAQRNDYPGVCFETVIELYVFFRTLPYAYYILQ